MLAGGLLAAIGTGWRAAGAGNPTRLLDVLGWFVAVGGAVMEARAAGFWFEIAPGPSRRRATLLVVLGLTGTLGGCVVASTVATDAGAVWEAAAMATLIGGVGALLGGFLSLAWTLGGDYAARRIERMGEDEW